VQSSAPDGRLILTASDDHAARMWASSSGVEILQLKETFVLMIPA
jgi:hypothetical protein